MGPVAQKGGKWVWTIGYEGRSLEGFVGELEEAGVGLLVDVRELPLSRKKGFSKTPLRKRLESAGIPYEHLKALGAPKAVRDPYLAGGDFKEFRKAYLAHLSTAKDALDRLRTLCRGQPAVLLCWEADPSACHRRFIAARLKRGGFQVEHL